LPLHILALVLKCLIDDPAFACLYDRGCRMVLRSTLVAESATH
jgi:hypothetical protein